MKEQTRNLLVGVTVLVALAVLGAMIIIFQELPTFMQVGYVIELEFPDSGGVTDGCDVLLAGKRIGRITHVEFKADVRSGVVLTALIDTHVNIPGDVNAYVGPRGFTGGAVVHLRCDGRPPNAGRKDPATGQPLAWIPKTGQARIEGRIADTGFIPSATLAKLDAALEAVNKTLGDAQNQANFRASLEKLKTGLDSFTKAADDAAAALAEARELFDKAKLTFAEVSDATKSASGRFDQLADRLIDDADCLGQVLTAFHRWAAKLDSADGTAGKLVNDPKLYNNLVDATAQLKATLDSLEDLLTEWKEKGIKVELK